MKSSGNWQTLSLPPTDNNSRLASFASLYHKVIVSVQEGMLNNEFENSTRMEQLDHIANRYATERPYKRVSAQPAIKYRN